MSQWANDAEDTAKTETAEDAEEPQEMEDEAYRKRLPENSNKDLIMEFTVQLRKMGNKCLGDHKPVAFTSGTPGSVVNHDRYKHRTHGSKWENSDKSP